MFIVLCYRCSYGNAAIKEKVGGESCPAFPRGVTMVYLPSTCVRIYLPALAGRNTLSTRSAGYSVTPSLAINQAVLDKRIGDPEAQGLGRLYAVLPQPSFIRTFVLVGLSVPQPALSEQDQGSQYLC